MKRNSLIFTIVCAFALASISAEEMQPLDNLQPLRSGFELSMSHLLRPSISSSPRFNYNCVLWCTFKRANCALPH